VSEQKCLVVFYSRTGTTRQVAEAVAEGLGADIEEIVDRKRRGGPLGFVVAGKDARLGRLTDIRPPSRSPGDYELLVVGTPVWAGTMSCAVRTYLTRFRESLPAVAFFLTTGGLGIKGTFRDMAELCGKEPVACLALKQRQVRKGPWREEVERFVRELLRREARAT